MTEATTSQLHSVTALFKEGSAKLAEHLAQQASLKSELDRSASEAEALGFQDFADLLREMAAKLGGTATHNGKDSAAGALRRGRPPKPADDPAPIT